MCGFVNIYEHEVGDYPGGRLQGRWWRFIENLETELFTMGVDKSLTEPILESNVNATQL